MDEDIKLRDLLPDKLQSAAAKGVARLKANDQVGGMTLAWNYIGDELEDSLQSSLDCDLLGVLAKGWAEWRDIAEYADETKHPKGETSVLSVGKGHISREVYPTLEVTVGSCPCVDVKFTFRLSAHYECLELSILNGHITRVAPGKGWVGAQLLYDDIPLHSEAESKKMQLPGEYRFAEPGIPIPVLA